MVILSYTIKISKENVPTNALKIFKKRSFYRDLWRADVFYLVTCKGGNRVTRADDFLTVNSLTHLYFLGTSLLYISSPATFSLVIPNYYNRNHYFSASRLDEHTEMRPNRWGKNSTNFKQGMGRKKRRTYLQSWCCFSGFFLLLHVWVFSDAPRVFGLL